MTAKKNLPPLNSAAMPTIIAKIKLGIDMYS